MARTVSLLLGGFAVALAAVLAALAFILEKPAPLAIATSLLLAILAIVLWLLLSHLVRPLDRLSLDLGIIARENPAHRLGLPTSHWLGKLAEGIEAIRRRLASAESQGAQALAEAQKQGEEQKRWLEAILLDLTEGIVMCNLQHQVLLYNQAAVDLFLL